MKNVSFNKIFVLGAGAIGSIYGAFLSKRNDVTLIGNKAHVNAIKTEGLSISGHLNDTFHVKAETEIREIHKKTLIILTTKAYDIPKAIEKLNKLFQRDTVILILQNGLGNEEIVKCVAGDKPKISRAITTMAAEFFCPGKIRFWKGETIIEYSEVAERIAETFNDSKLKTRLANDFRRELWKKLIVNCVVNPLSALFQVRNCEIVVDSLKNVRYDIVKECCRVGRADGTILSEDLCKEIDEEISKYTNFSSMNQDIMKNKSTEIDFLNGKIAELGRKYHIPTPVNETLVCAIKFLEEKNGIPRKN